MASACEIEENATSQDSDLNNAQADCVRISDLKVVDLKAELEKRNLDKTGVKCVLAERLKKALLEEGCDPNNLTIEFKKGKQSFEIEGFSERNGLKNEMTLKEPCEKKQIEEETIEDTENFEVHVKDDESIETNSLELCENKGESDLKVHAEYDAIDNIVDDSLKINNDNDDKGSSSEVTLQLSIDEEDAQLNGENLLEIPKSDFDSHIKSKDIGEDSESLEKDSSSEKTQSVQSSPTKLLVVEGTSKDKKKASPKSIETSNLSSPKFQRLLSKSDKSKNVNTLAKCLWITGLPNSIRAADLKELFSKQGRVLSVKIVKSTKQTPGKCHGFVTMATSKDAAKAISNLHRTELGGRTISVEHTQTDPSVLLKKTELKKPESKSINLNAAKKQPVKKEFTGIKRKHISSSFMLLSIVDRKTTLANKAKQDTKLNEKKSPDLDKSKEKVEIVSKGKSKETEQRSLELREKDKEHNDKEHRVKAKPIRDKYREHRFKEKERRETIHRRPMIRRQQSYNHSDRFKAQRRSFAPRPYMGRPTNNFTRPSNTTYSLLKIREERLRLRAEREAERKKLEEITRQQYIERKQREEAYRLQREKEKLRLERELLEREKAEVLKFEREKQRFERERLEREREELRRQSVLRRGVKRPTAPIERESEQYWEARKKAPQHYETSFPVASSSRYQYPVKETAPVQPDRRLNRYKPSESISRAEYKEPRREITIRPREERHTYERSSYRLERNVSASRIERSVSSSYQERDRHSSSKREAPRREVEQWKHDRKMQQRAVSSNVAPRRMYY